MKLEPLLDAGVKADFTGMKKGVLTNFDVTSNLSFKDIDDYLEVTQSRGKIYEIVLVDLNGEEIIYYPLKFPICKKCGSFSYDVLYIIPPTTETGRMWQRSDEQIVIRYCPKCKCYNEIKSLDYDIQSINEVLEEMSSEKDVDDTFRFKKRDILKTQAEMSISLANFFERESDTIISGVAENYYVVTDPRDYNGYLDGLLHWKHPLAKKLPHFLGLHYGEWKPGVQEIRQLYSDFECHLCRYRKFRINAEKLTLTCYRCGAIHDISNSLVYKGYELQRTRKVKSPFKDFKPTVSW